MSKLIQQFILQDFFQAENITSDTIEETPIDNSCLSEEISSSIPENAIVYTLEEIEAIKLNSYEDGYKKARDELINKQNSTIETLLAQISSQLEDILNKNYEHTQNNLNIISKIALEIAKKVTNNYLHTKSTVQKIAKHAMNATKLLQNCSNLTLKVNSEVAELLKSSLNELGNINQQFIIIEIDNTLSKGDCKIEWAQGYIEYNQEQLFNNIEKAILTIK
ncbi:MAG: FliH/SctL family protein [Rickettsiales endosymbiont of Dermacentor nuttalli]